jgi:large subunit ribosomal protein L4
MAGHMGDRLRTMLNIEIIKTDLENELLYLKGSIPGSKNTEVVVRQSVKNINKMTISEKITAAEEAKKTPDKKKKIMKLEKLSIDGKKDTIDVLDKIFSAKINSKLVSSVLYKTNANYKGRHAKTKQQNEVSGPTSKIYAQKGTGGARHASRKAPIFVGGGIAHGPKGELAYKKRKLNKNEKKLSVASLITEKNNNKNLLILNDFSSEIKKTKEMNALINKLEITNSLIILDKVSKEKIEKSARNIPNVKVTDVNHFSSYDIIKFKKVVFTESSVKELEKRYT